MLVAVFVGGLVRWVFFLIFLFVYGIIYFVRLFVRVFYYARFRYVSVNDSGEDGWAFAVKSLVLSFRNSLNS